jgi:hypothetical protein
LLDTNKTNSILDTLSFDLVDIQESDNKNLNIYFNYKSKPDKIKGYIKIYNPEVQGLSNKVIANGYYIEDTFLSTRKKGMFTLSKIDTSYVLKVKKYYMEINGWEYDVIDGEILIPNIKIQPNHSLEITR